MQLTEEGLLGGPSTVGKPICLGSLLRRRSHIRNAVGRRATVHVWWRRSTGAMAQMRRDVRSTTLLVLSIRAKVEAIHVEVIRHVGKTIVDRSGIQDSSRHKMTLLRSEMTRKEIRRNRRLYHLQTKVMRAKDFCHARE